MRIALNIIAKNEKDKLLKIISDYHQYFDEIVIAVDRKKIVDELANRADKIKVFHYTHKNEDGLLDFAHKRNFCMDKTESDFIFRLDTDDIIGNPENIRDLVEHMDKDGISVLTTLYDYAKDKWGNTIASHYRETLIRNNGNCYWATTSGIHECILPVSLNNFILTSTDRVKIIHDIDEGHGEKSAKRNIVYLMNEYKRKKDKTDPRTFSYLGRTLYGLGHLKEAIFFLEQHIQKSGWADDRYFSWCLLGDIHLKFSKNYEQARACAFEALAERSDFPDAYFLLHDCYFNEERYEKSLEWGKMGFEKPFPKTNIFVDPSSYTWRPMLSMAECYFQMGEFEKAKRIFDKAKTYVPTLDYIRNTEPIYQEGVEHNSFVKHFLWLYNYLMDKKEDKVKDLIKVVPDELSKHELLAKISHQHAEPHVWKDKEIAIFCGGTTEDWSPKSTSKGVGGSEEAVIHLSKELTQLGYKVVVYNTCGDCEGTYDGVEYKNIVHFNPRDRFNVLVSWRANVFDYKIQARQKIVWVHDLPSVVKFTEDSVKTVDKVIVLSDYHASLLPDCVPKEKVFISTNGINPKDFEVEGVKREPKRLIWASSYNRGLEKILENWGKIKEAVPETTLHIFYGWDVYDQYVRKGLTKDGGFKANMVKLMSQDGIYEHGRIGHKELVKEYLKSDVFAYPCTYSGEINCIALTKAIACGCKVITNDFAVLKERSPLSVKDAEFIDGLISLLKGDTKQKPIDTKNYIKKMSWESVAKDWVKILHPEVDTEVYTRLEWIWDNISKDDKIVDIGSNKGHIFTDWDRTNITSVDIDKYDIPNFVQANANDLPFKDKEFDVALLAEILEHIPTSPVKAMKEARRVANRVVITVPYEYEWKSDLKPFNTLEKEMKLRNKTAEELAKIGNPTAKEFAKDGGKHLYHERYYTPETLRKDLEKAGFKKIKVIRLRRSEWAWIGAICS